jgi:hypothetical protein
MPGDDGFIEEAAWIPSLSLSSSFARPVGSQRRQDRAQP